MIRSVILIIILVGSVRPGKRNGNVFLNLPVGEYRTNFKSFYSCDPAADKIQFKYYLNKKSDNSTEIKGNMTLLKPLDDSLLIDVNVAIKEANGAWKENVFLFGSEKACSTFKKFMCHLDLSGLGHNCSCPVTKGVYIATGFDTSNLEKLNYIPKMFAYGTYKIRAVLKDVKNQSYGCLICIVQLIRKLEMF